MSASSRKKCGKRFICLDALTYSGNLENLAGLESEQVVEVTPSHLVIDDESIEETLEANIPLGKPALSAAIQEYKDHITFLKRN